MATVVPSSVTTVTVNAAFFQEIKDVNQELWHLLDDVRAICSNAWSVHQRSAQLIELLGDLRDQVALHFALEEAFGYFEDPAFAPWRISEKAVELRAEHRQLYVMFSRLVDDAEQMFFEGNFADLVTRIPARFWAFDRQLKRHESRENALIMSQFDEFGVGD